MILKENLEEELKHQGTDDATLMLKILQQMHGEQAGLKLFVEQMFWNIQARAEVNGQDAVLKHSN